MPTPSSILCQTPPLPVLLPQCVERRLDTDRPAPHQSRLPHSGATHSAQEVHSELPSQGLLLMAWLPMIPPSAPGEMRSRRSQTRLRTDQASRQQAARLASHGSWRRFGPRNVSDFSETTVRTARLAVMSVLTYPVHVYGTKQTKASQTSRLARGFRVDFSRSDSDRRAPRAHEAHIGRSPPKGARAGTSHADGARQAHGLEPIPRGKMEAGDPAVSLDLLVQGLLAAGATRRDIAAALASRKKAVGA